MKIEIHAAPVFWLHMTLEQVEVLEKAARWHYDGTCHASVLPGGFIYGWLNTLHFFAEYPGPDKPTLRADFRSLDLTLKILENRSILKEDSEIVLADEINRSVRLALGTANENIGKIHIKVE